MIECTNQQIETPEVIVHTSHTFSLDRSGIDCLVASATKNKRNRVRLCAHKTKEEKVHEMFIVHPRHAYVRPHKHIGKSESILVLQGDLDFLIFDETGKIKERIEMGVYNSGRQFFQHTGPECIHTLVIHSEWLVFLEITEGPFVERDTHYAEWSPEESDLEGATGFVKSLIKDTII